MSQPFIHSTVYVEHPDGFRWALKLVDEGMMGIQYQEFRVGEGWIDRCERMDITEDYIDKFVEALTQYNNSKRPE